MEEEISSWFGGESDHNHVPREGAPFRGLDSFAFSHSCNEVLPISETQSPPRLLSLSLVLRQHSEMFQREKVRVFNQPDLCTPLHFATLLLCFIVRFSISPILLPSETSLR